MKDESTPIELEVKRLGTSKSQSLVTFSSYSFDRNMLVPASPFRFTAEGVSYEAIQAIRSADTAGLWIKTPTGNKVQIATGFIDETDSHTTGSTDEYVLTGRDTLGQLVDNAAVDGSNRVVHLESVTLVKLALELIKNTRMIQNIKNNGCPNGKVLFRTNPGETKINALQRYLEYTNCLIWSEANGTLAMGKPDMIQSKKGDLILKRTDPRLNNVLDLRSRRNLNMAIRKIAIPMQSMQLVDPSPVTLTNQDGDMRAALKVDKRVGRSVFRAYTLGNGEGAVNTLVQVGKNGTPQQISYALARREIARSNMNVLEIECVVRGHVNENGLPYNVNQVYHVEYEKDGVNEDMYVYAARYDLTKDHGRTTTLRLCRLGTLVADVPVKRK